MNGLAVSISWLSFIFSIVEGLELSLNLQAPTSPRQQNLCGILTCEGSLPTDTNNVSMKTSSSITGLTIFQSTQSSVTLDVIEKGMEIATVTSDSPNLMRVSNGLRVTGELRPEKASLTLGMVKEVDCSAQYSCQMRTSDGDTQTNRLGQRSTQPAIQKDADSLTTDLLLKQLISLQQEQLTLLTSSMTSWDVKFEVLETRLDAMEQRVKDTLLSVHNKIETKVVEKLDKMSDKVVNSWKNEKNVIVMLDKVKNGLDNLSKELNYNDNKCPGINSFCLTNSTSEMVISVMTSVDELLAMEKTNIHKLDHLMDVNKKMANLSETLNDRILIHSVMLSKDGEQLKNDAENCSTKAQYHPVDSFLTIKDGENSAADMTSETICKKWMSVSPQDTIVYDHYVIINPNAKGGLVVPFLCDIQTDDGGWVVIQRRSSGLVDFYQSWEDYKLGFGSLHDDFWLGNELVHNLTSNGTWELRVDMQYGGNSYFAHYSVFSIDGEANNYALTVGEYTGNAGDALQYHNRKSFSTFDRDNDDAAGNPSIFFAGGWWYGRSYTSNLNGKWDSSVSLKRAIWWSLTEDDSVTFSEMKIRKL